jgi:hypothetical protein
MENSFARQMIGRQTTDGAGAAASRWQRWGDVANPLLVGPFALLLVVFVVRSLGWRTEHDVPLAHYSAFMHAEYGARPYQQLFEISFPGTILVHLAITRVFGYGDSGVMLANVLWFVALSGVTAAMMVAFGRMVAVGAVVLFGVAYFAAGQGMMMQRDAILILFVATALLLHVRNKGPDVARRLIVGLLIGAAAAMKPHATVALIPIIVDEIYPLWRARAKERVRTTAVALAGYGIGFVVPCALVFAWLIAAGGFGGWLEMSQKYLPLYLHMTGKHETIAGAARLLNIIKGFVSFGGQTAWFLGAGIGTFLLLTRVESSAPAARLARLLLGEAAVFAVYPAFAGQFWPYHYMPFVYFLALLASLCLVTLPAPRTLAEALLPKAALAISLLGNAQLVDAAGRLGRERAVKSGEVDEIASFLNANLRPGDTVQPLDWTGGVVHAMLIARARLATRFMYDYHFYHHVSQPFIQVLRQRMMSEIAQTQPRFVVEYFGELKPWPEGKDTTREFPELRAFLAANYRVDVAATDYRIYEHRAAAN